MVGLGVVRPKMHDLRGSSLFERLDPEVGRERLYELGPTDRQRCLQLLRPRLVGQADEQGPVPVALIDASHHVLGGGPLTRPPETLERPDTIHDAPSLEGEVERVGGRVQAGHARGERVVAGLALAVDHHEAVDGQVHEPHGAERSDELVRPTVGRANSTAVRSAMARP